MKERSTKFEFAPSKRIGWGRRNGDNLTGELYIPYERICLYANISSRDNSVKWLRTVAWMHCLAVTRISLFTDTSIPAHAVSQLSWSSFLAVKRPLRYQCHSLAFCCRVNDCVDLYLHSAIHRLRACIYANKHGTNVTIERFSISFLIEEAPRSNLGRESVLCLP
jgi:hypothetical protein